jgi:hypothetical protein
MKKPTLKILSVLTCLFLFVGCSSTPEKPKIKTTDKFIVSGVSVTLSQTREPSIEYHSQDEIEALFSEKISEKLKSNNLLADDDSANALDIKIKYRRQFMGDGTPLPSDSLRGPLVSYEVYIKDGETLLTTVSEGDMEYYGKMAVRLKLLAGQLRSKSDEISLVDSVSGNIVEKIKQMKN